MTFLVVLVPPAGAPSITAPDRPACIPQAVSEYNRKICTDIGAAVTG